MSKLDAPPLSVHPFVRGMAAEHIAQPSEVTRYTACQPGRDLAGGVAGPCPGVWPSGLCRLGVAVECRLVLPPPGDDLWQLSADELEVPHGLGHPGPGWRVRTE